MENYDWDEYKEDPQTIIIKLQVGMEITLFF